MRFYAAGGCMEHGRNCFLLEGSGYSVLVDCGIAVGKEHGYPLLSREQVSNIRFCFLTHSHRDHTGALDWLYGMGFQGQVVMSEETARQIHALRSGMRIIPLKKSGELSVTPDLTVMWGRSGHCMGSIWYKLDFQGKSIFFSGDYCENSRVYECDTVSSMETDMAVIDCAYGEKEGSLEQYFEKLEDFFRKSSKKGKAVMLPAPFAGRGVELFRMAVSYSPPESVYIDKELRLHMEALRNQQEWITDGKFLETACSSLYSERWHGGPGFLIVSDPQLKKPESLELVKRIEENDGSVILTGHTYEKTSARKMLEEKTAQMLLCPVHMNEKAVHQLCSRNNFKKIVLNHCPEPIHTVLGARNVKAGDEIIF